MPYQFVPNIAFTESHSSSIIPPLIMWIVGLYSFSYRPLFAPLWEVAPLLSYDLKGINRGMYSFFASR